MESTYFVWDVSPVIFEIGFFQLRYYSLCFMLSFLIGFFIMRRIFIKESKPLVDLDPLFIFMMAGTAIGARLGHCLFYDPGYYLSNPLEILKVWEGGLASHGGLIGILIALYLYAKNRKNQSYLWLLDRMAIPTALGGFFIRLGNFFNSEILGKQTDVAWAVIFKQIDMIPRHPVQLYESLAYLVIFIFLGFMYRKLDGNIPNGLIVGSFLTLIFGWRIFAEFFKVRQAAYGYGLPLSVGQWLSVPVVIIGIYLIFKALQKRKI